MDSYRGTLTDHTLPGPMGEIRDRGEDEIERDAPPASVGQDERRMQVRAYNHWAGLLGTRNFPRIVDLEPDALPDFGPYSVLLDFTAGIENPAIRFLGAKLAEECGTAGQIATLADVPSRSLLSRITDHYMQILANQAPIGFEAEFVNQRAITILYRGILLPFSSNDTTIDWIYGVINWKELADQDTTDALLLEIDQALATGSSDARRAELLTPWADGPDSGSIDPAAAAASRLGGSGWLVDDPDGLTLADWLAAAREQAEAARGSEDRTRHALYAAIGLAHDFAIAATQAPAEFALLAADAGLTVQARAPLTPVVKLVFGAHYDKTRLTEYAAALAHAQRIGLKCGELAAYLAAAPGGLKGVVHSERQYRRQHASQPAPRRRPARIALDRKLRGLPCQSFAALPATGAEFAVVIARRLPSGEVALLGEVADDAGLLERAARKLIDGAPFPR